MRCVLLFLTIVSFSVFAYAQPFFLPKKYPSRSFRNPLLLPFAFVGNFGETRPNHFHSGLDMRTGAKENQAVHAVDDGYISRVKIEARGFGNAIYITHASGYTTVYAHLNKFYPALENFIRKKQYQNQDWNIDISFFPDQFWVRKGSFIAWSGNTGSSQGPHLHFEVRDAKSEAPLNPLLFFDEITDDKKPVIHQLAFYDGTKSIYEQVPAIHPLYKGRLKKDTIVVGTDKVFLGIRADDYMPMGFGTLGIYEMRMFVNEQPVLAWQMDNISYDITRYVNALADYKTRKIKNVTFQLCRKLPNNKLSVYKAMNGSDGMIDLSDGNPRQVRIEVFDTRNNSSSVSFTLLSNKKSAALVCNNPMTAGKKNIFSNEHISFTLPADALYDHICFNTSVSNSSNLYSHIYRIHQNFVPLHSAFELMLKPKKNIPDALKQKVAVVLRNGATIISGTSARIINYNVVATLNQFGDYEIVIDERAPVITSKLKEGMNISKSKALYFVVKEETTSVKKCTAIVDGQWLRLVQKGNTYTYEMDEYFPAGKHRLVITATDENENTRTQTYTLIK